MSIIEQAAKRLEELRRGGVDIPWGASGLSEERFDALQGRAAPAAPAAPRPALDTGTAAGGSLLAEAMRRRDAAPSEAAHAVPAAPRTPGRASATVEIDLDALGRKGYLVPSMVRSALALEFRNIKRPLLRHALKHDQPGSRGSLIMVTSALAGEGKTFCSLNLAMSMAMEVDSSVLLVDADVVRPAVLDRLGLPPAPGLMDLLTDDKLEVADVILRTNVPKLSILPAGSPNVMATELLASAAMDRLLLDLATRYSDRVVILDAPPLLLSTEARVLASRVGQVVVVVDSSKTPVAKVTEAFTTVENSPQVTAVLNKTAAITRPSEYDYGYGYR
jgi:exopolysaccharide/PEP-CTERM locus tyrosine autokinase